MSSFLDVSGRVAIRLVGAESLDFIQRISTNDVSALDVGQSRQTVLTSEKARIIEVVTIQREAEGRILLLGQSNDSAQVIAWLEKYVIMEDIQVSDITSSLSQYILYDGYAIDQYRPTIFTSQEIIMLREEFGNSTLVRLVTPNAFKESVEQSLAAIGVTRGALEEFESYRVINSIPGPQTELTPQYNPLEANLGSLISWTKGCYIGQEVIARLDTYKKIQRHLVRLSMPDGPTVLPGPFQDEEGEAGIITSAVRTDFTGEVRGLGYVKSSARDHSKVFSFLKDGVKIPLQVFAIA